MNFNMIGNMTTYLRTTELKSMWNMRQKNNDYTSKGQERLDQMFERMYSKNGEQADGTDNRLSDIRNKLNTGQSLSPDELEYLRQKDPKTYNDLQQEEQEQKAFEKKLRQCKTKEDVERLKMTRIGQSLSAIGAVENNPTIPKGQKLGIILKEGRRMKRVEAAVAKFVKSGEFAQLPTDAEAELARKEEAAKKQPTQTTEEDTATTEKNEQAENTDAAENSAPTDTAEQADQPKAAAATREHPAAKPATSTATKPTTSAASCPESLVASPELQKVRRARAKAAYAARSPEHMPKHSASAPSLEYKA